ncbi:MAG: ABC transporter ATP-binding protein [Desulfotomaculales bacterium]
MAEATYLVQMEGITKHFPGVTANYKITFDLLPGEIHALLGENGSGKSTLMSILAGLYHPDDGRIFIAGKKVNFRSPRDAIQAGIGMVHQHFRLVETFTVAENIILGDTAVPFFLRMRRLENKIAALGERYGLKIDPHARIWQLSVGERQRVEIVKMLYRGCRELILDEPTAVLTPQETKDLFANLRIMALEGKAVVLITHKLQEVMQVADRVTVLRGGRAVGTLGRGTYNERELARLMIGRDIAPKVIRMPSVRGEVVLELRDVQVMNDLGRPGLDGVSLAVHEGEILGVAGIAGNGQRELAEAVAGLRKVTRGRIYIGGEDCTNLGPRKIIDKGVAHIPEDRLGSGLVAGLGALDNLILKEYRQRGFSRGPFIDRQAATARAAALTKQFDVRLTGDLNAPVRLLSGGNLQRLLLAREISASPRLIIAVYPSRGLDIAATDTVHQLLVKQRARGAAVLLVSEDLDEIFKLSDRIAVLFKGRLAGILPAEGTDPQQVGLLMMGAGLQGAEAV